VRIVDGIEPKCRQAVQVARDEHRNADRRRRRREDAVECARIRPPPVMQMQKRMRRFLLQVIRLERRERRRRQEEEQHVRNDHQQRIRQHLRLTVDPQHRLIVMNQTPNHDLNEVVNIDRREWE
jgi:hypothetical protein